MSFLKDELEGLPSEVVKAALSELEAAIRAIRCDTGSVMPGHDLKCIVACAKMKSLLDFAERFRSQLREKETDAR